MFIPASELDGFIKETGLRQKDLADKISAVLRRPFHANNITNYLTGRAIPLTIQHAMVTVLSDLTEDQEIWAKYREKKIPLFMPACHPPYGWVGVHNGYPSFMLRMKVKSEPSSETEYKFSILPEEVIPLNTDLTESDIITHHKHRVQATFFKTSNLMDKVVRDKATAMIRDLQEQQRAIMADIHNLKPDGDINDWYFLHSLLGHCEPVHPQEHEPAGARAGHPQNS